MTKGKPVPSNSLEVSIAAVCRMPAEYRSRGNVTWNDLQSESGYSLHRESMTEDLIEKHLRAHPDLVDAWQTHSWDQRSHPNWGMSPPEPPKTRHWTVFYYSAPGDDLIQEHAFDDPFRACAFFIKRKMEPGPRGYSGTCLGGLIVLAVLLVVSIAVRAFVDAMK